MIATADASFLVSLYGEDVNTAAAEQWIRVAAVPLWLTPFGWFEAENALRLCNFRKRLTGAQLKVGLSRMQEDLAAGILLIRDFPASTLAGAAGLLSGQTTETQGGRAFDVFHVAAARLLGADTFLSFDGRQRELADLAGLTVAP